MSPDAIDSGYRDDSLIVAERIAVLERELDAELGRANEAASPWRRPQWVLLSPSFFLAGTAWLLGTEPMNAVWAALHGWAGAEFFSMALAITVPITAATFAALVLPMWLGSRLRQRAVRRLAYVAPMSTGRDRVASLERALHALQQPRLPERSELLDA